MNDKDCRDVQERQGRIQQILSGCKQVQINDRYL